MRIFHLQMRHGVFKGKAGFQGPQCARGDDADPGGSPVSSGACEFWAGTRAKGRPVHAGIRMGDADAKHHLLLKAGGRRSRKAARPS
jgi:hypothetical protein